MVWIRMEPIRYRDCVSSVAIAISPFRLPATKHFALKPRIGRRLRTGPTPVGRLPLQDHHVRRTPVHGPGHVRWAWGAR